MAYVELIALQALIPEPDLVKALDDDADGVIDAWTTVEAQASVAVDALLSMRYEVPFTEPPLMVTNAAKVFAAELCYKRRGISDEMNPWFSAADKMRTLLAKIGAGDLPIAPQAPQAAPRGAIISEPSATYSQMGGRIG